MPHFTLAQSWPGRQLAPGQYAGPGVGQPVSRDFRSPSSNVSTGERAAILGTGMSVDDFTFVLYLITFPITMKQDVQAERASVHGWESHSGCSAREKKSCFKNSCTIVCDT